MGRDALNPKVFYPRYEGGGARNQTFHPALMISVLVFGSATGVFSSRKIERRPPEGLARPIAACLGNRRPQTMRPPVTNDSPR